MAMQQSTFWIPMPPPCAVRLIHTPEALEQSGTPGFSFRVEHAYQPQRAGRAVISAMVANINGRSQDMRIFSDRIESSSVVCLGALGTPFLFLDFTVEERALRIDARCFRASLSHLSAFVAAARRLSCSEAFSLQHDGELSRYRALLFRHLID
jgi:hypothetical protein